MPVLKKKLLLVLIAVIVVALGAVLFGIIRAGGFAAWRCETSGGRPYRNVHAPGSPVECVKPLADAGAPCDSPDSCLGRCIFDADTTLLPARDQGPDFGLYGGGGPMDRQRRLPQALLDMGCRPTEPDARGYSVYDCASVGLSAMCEEYDFPIDCEHVWVMDGRTIKLDRDRECDVTS